MCGASMPRTNVWLSLLLATSVVLTMVSTDAADSPAKPLKPIPAAVQKATFAKDIAPLVKKYCAACHLDGQSKGDLSLEGFKDEASVASDKDTWEKVLDNLKDGLMPPEGKPQPTAEERQLLSDWIEHKVLKLDCSSQIDPGRVTLRRLNRAEYNNTIRDLCKIDFRPADDFPADDVGYGFDNIGDVLTIPPLLLEKYLAAAEKIAELSILDADQTAPGKLYHAREMTHAEGHKHGENAWIFPSNGELSTEYEFPKNGEYVIKTQSWAQQAGPEPAKLRLRIDGKDATVFEVKASAESQPGMYEFKAKVVAGKFKVALAFINDFYDKDNKDPRKRDRNLIVNSVEIRGPLGEEPTNLPESHKAIVICQPTPANKNKCTTTIVRNFASRAFRRPATDDEVKKLVALVQLAESEGDPWERGLRLAVTAVLVSPQFLFKVELQPETDKKGKPLGDVYVLNDFELATRLSYFLWSSLPDEELLELARRGDLRRFGNLEKQIQRMLKDDRSVSLVQNFAGQWLQLRNLDQIKPDPKKFPTFNDELRSDMRRETELFFHSLIKEDRSILELLNGRSTFLNERLAKHYGIEGVTGNEFRQVALTDDRRGGLLGQASILTVTSNPTRTSPVKRGKWILENLLNVPPPLPPPNVPELEAQGAKLTGSLRQRMEQHRANPACAACHQRLDPLGFGLENFDAIGAWRSKDEDQEIDASGTLPGGESFKTPAELRSILVKRETDFRECLTEKLLTYALGRGVEYDDKCTVVAISHAAAKKGNKFSAVVFEIVKSDLFQKARRVKK